MKRYIILIVTLAAVLAFTTGCNLPVSSDPPPDSQSVEQTHAAETVAARLEDNGGDEDPADPPAATTEAPPDAPPTETPTPTNTPTVTPTPTEDIPCNRASFVKDVTVPDGKEYAPGATFTKTWRLKNTGTCNWNNDYDLVFASGDKMNGGDVVDITIGSVAPGDTVDISVDLKAPGSSGTYKGNWKLRSDDNQIFGLNDSSNPFYVEIKVVNPPDPADFEILSSHSYSCGGDNFVTLRIENTGSDSLESSGGSLYNANTDALIVTYLFWNTPFTENKNDCPVMGIDDMEPGDIYYVSYNHGSATGKFKYALTLCTGENGGGDCATREIVRTVP